MKKEEKREIEKIQTLIQVCKSPNTLYIHIKLANHHAFERGDVETHFIEHYKDDLFVDPSNLLMAKEAYEAAGFNASLAAACIVSLEHSKLAENFSGNDLHSIWYSPPPFRVHHCARCTVEFAWENQYDSSGSKPFPLTITYQQDGGFLVESGESGSSAVEVKVSHLGKHNFRVEVDGVIMEVRLAIYSKDQIKHVHIWHGSGHHHFKQKLGIDVVDEDESQHKPGFEATSNHPQGTVVAPMAGLVVKVLMKNGDEVGEGQPVLVLEAMKMEHVVKAPIAGQIYGLHVAPGQQVTDGSSLFSVKKN